MYYVDDDDDDDLFCALLSYRARVCALLYADTTAHWIGRKCDNIRPGAVNSIIWQWSVPL